MNAIQIRWTLALLLSVSIHAAAQTPPPSISISSTATQAATLTPFTARDLANEEAKFAAYAVKTGMFTAFRAFFADKSTLLRPGPIDAQAWMKGRPDPPIILDWRAQLTVLSASGDLGLSTGPWTRVAKATPDAAKSYGQFFSVWQKQANGAWKVLIDHGVSHPTFALGDAALHARELPVQPATRGLDDQADDDAEAAFIGATARLGMRAAYANAINNNSRLLRDEKPPADGVQAILAALKDDEGGWAWTPQQQGLSSARDMRYCIGQYVWTHPSGAKQRGQYVRVWVREGQPARWVIAGEIVTPTPETTPPK